MAQVGYMEQEQLGYPVQFSVDYPDRPLSRLSTAFRILLVIPIAIVLTTVSGYVVFTVPSHTYGITYIPALTGGVLFYAPLLMILFRRKYPRWWFDWNLELQRFTNRVTVYLSLMDDRYPSTDDRQSVHLDYLYPDRLNRWLPLIKWLLAIPHYIVLFFLNIASFLVVIVVWFAILITGRYPKSPVRLRRRGHPLECPGDRLHPHPRHRPLSAVPAGGIRSRPGMEQTATASKAPARRSGY
jgi:uncharacterized protein DUF4389